MIDDEPMRDPDRLSQIADRMFAAIERGDIAALGALSSDDITVRGTTLPVPWPTRYSPDAVFTRS